MLLLSIVEDAFELPNISSVIVVPGIPRRDYHVWKLKVGQPIMLEAPDGTIHHTVIRGIDRLSPPHLDCIPVVLGPGVSKQMSPIGTKIWMNEAAVL